MMEDDVFPVQIVIEDTNIRAFMDKGVIREKNSCINQGGCSLKNLLDNW